MSDANREYSTITNDRVDYDKESPSSRPRSESLETVYPKQLKVGEENDGNANIEDIDTLMAHKAQIELLLNQTTKFRRETQTFGCSNENVGFDAFDRKSLQTKTGNPPTDDELKTNQTTQRCSAKENDQRTKLVESPIQSADENDSPTSSCQPQGAQSGKEYENGGPLCEITRRILENGRYLKSKNGLYDVVIPSMEELKIFPEKTHIHKIIVGGSQPSTEKDKVIYLFGLKDSGKTSVIISLLNYLYNVEAEHPFRLALSEEESATDELTAYVLNNTIFPYSITVVDTPGVIEEDGCQTTSNLTRIWFQQELKINGKFHLDVISVVLRSNESSLGWNFITELSTVKQLFGNNLKINVFPIITFSQILPQPPAVRALAIARIVFLEYYKINNAAFLASTCFDSKLNLALVFTQAIAVFERYFTDLSDLVEPLFIVDYNKSSDAEVTEDEKSNDEGD
ncbi:hypothetical protein AB6A40_005989 [Gnathostoma spinigerum]|uniref:G domain-containing protein n=1 Tax=Gnathostoma spinigerum TaxID=75299 RepID=A0ABD6EH14_9BILA